MNYQSGMGAYDRMPDSLGNGDWSGGLVGELNQSNNNLDGSNPYGYDSSMYNSGGFDSAWDASGNSPLGSSLEGMYGAGSESNPFSYDVNSGAFNPNDYSNFGTGYTPTSADRAGVYSNEGYGANPSTSSSSDGNDFLKRYKNAVGPLQPLLRNPIISTLMSLNPITAIAKAALQGPTSAGGFLGSLFGRGMGPLGSLLGGLAGSQGANYATEGQFAPMSGSQVGGIAGGLAGSMSGNPYGSLLGGFAGSQLGGMNFGSSGGGIGNTGFSSGNGGFSLDTMGGLPTGMNNGFGGALGNIGMSYNNNRQIGNQIKTLEGLFGQDSPYAKQMRQQLERRDAAAGRRSQYGNREVELQAALAGNAAKLQPGLQQLYSQKMGNTNLLVQSLLRNPNLTQGIKEGWNGLTGMFGGNAPQSAPVYENPFGNNGGGFQSGNEGMGD